MSVFEKFFRKNKEEKELSDERREAAQRALKEDIAFRKAQEELRQDVKNPRNSESSTDEVSPADELDKVTN